MTLTALLQKEDEGYSALCTEMDVASQGDTVEEALANLREAVELFLECASPEEIKARHKGQTLITHIEVPSYA